MSAPIEWSRPSSAAATGAARDAPAAPARRSRLLPIALLIALVPVAFVASVLLLLALATAVIVAAAGVSSRPQPVAA